MIYEDYALTILREIDTELLEKNEKEGKRLQEVVASLLSDFNDELNRKDKLTVAILQAPNKNKYVFKTTNCKDELIRSDLASCWFLEEDGLEIIFLDTPLDYHHTYNVIMDEILVESKKDD